MSDKRFSKGDNFVIFSEQLEGILRGTIEDSEYTFLFTSRRGLAPTVVCMDCGHTVECSNCEAPVILHGPSVSLGATNKKNYFLCHRCNEKRTAGELCKNCGGWRLKTLGIGSELVKQEINKKFPELKVFILDGDHATSPAKAHKTVDDFLANPGSVIIGTEMALLYLKEPVENVGVISVDSMLSNPDFNINEKILNTILKVKALATRTFTLQTRRAEEPVLKYIISGNIAEFIRLEFNERKKYSYPPFSILIKIIIKGTPTTVEKEFTKLREYLDGYDLMEYPILRESTKAKITRGGVIKFPRNQWPDKDLSEKLKSLPNYYKIVVNTENIF